MKIRKHVLPIITFTLLFSLCGVLAHEAKADAKSIKYRKEFREIVLIEDVENQKIDKNEDGKLSQKEINAVPSFVVGTEGYGECDNVIVALDDLKIFKNLRTLKIDVNVYSLKPLYKLEKIQNLTIAATVTKKKSLKFYKFPKLKKLEVFFNKLGDNLDVTKNKKLEKLSCEACGITSLNVRKNPCLRELNCSNNELEKLDVSKNTKLKTLYCSENKIRKLKLTSNLALKTLWCGRNELKEIRLNRNTKLKDLDCSVNRLETIQNLNVMELERFDCADNCFQTLELQGATKLDYVSCDNNLLKKIDLSGAKNLTFLYALKNNGIPCHIILPVGFTNYKIGKECVVEYER